MGEARLGLVIRLRPCGAGPARVCFKARIPNPRWRQNTHALRASAGGASSRLPASTPQVASRIRTPTHHASALEGQAPACPPKNPRRPNTGKEDLAPPPCGSPPESERPRITRQRWRGKLPLARRRIHDAQTRARRTLPLHPAGRLSNPNAPASRASAGGASSRLPAEGPTRPPEGNHSPPVSPLP